MEDKKYLELMQDPDIRKAIEYLGSRGFTPAQYQAAWDAYCEVQLEVNESQATEHE